MKHKNCWTSFRSIESIVQEQKEIRKAMVIDVILGVVLLFTLGALSIIGLSL